MKHFWSKIQAFKNTTTGYILFIIFLIGTFAFPDICLRVSTRWIGAYSIFALAPNLFTLLWSMILTFVVTLIPSRMAGRIVYGILYYFFMIYSIVQYGAYLALGKFLYVSDFTNAGEGAEYASWVIGLLTPSVIIMIILLTVIGLLGLLLFPSAKYHSIKGNVIRISAIILCVLAMIPIPKLYGDASGESKWDDFTNCAIEYIRFVNSNTDMELTGLYQYLFRDICIQVERATKDYSEDITMIDEYFSVKEDHSDNKMTGIFEGKNVIVFMMETMDDWMITPSDTPTIYKMMSEGINFKNFYTPEYSTGYTFNTEFAFNTCIYPYVNGSTAYSLIRNNYKYNIATQLSSMGYTVNSYHEGLNSFYNREAMHNAWGYEKYHSYQDYTFTDIDYHDDRYLIACNELYSELVSNEPFFSFVITYSPHLPYTDDDPLTQTALELYPEYDVIEDRKINILRSKARLTDDMFKGLLERLDEDGLLEDTVIVGFGDHYAYGLNDDKKLQQLSEEAGSPILERTPAFIYCAGYDLSIDVDKVMQITDLSPTIMNLLGLKVPTEIMGHDIFDENYEGYVFFANGWLNSTTYVRNGIVQWNNGMTAKEISEMNRFVMKAYIVNDAILDSDYYAHTKDH